MKPILTPIESMDQLPVTHSLTKAEQEFLAKADQKTIELHDLAVKWLQTSYRLEWSHMFNPAKH
jgi:hypothetical protein